LRCKGRLRLGPAVLAAAVLAAVCPGNVLAGNDSGQPIVPSAAVSTVPLEYRETRYQFMFRDVPIERRLVPFSKEPAAAHGAVVRGVFKFGPNPSNAVPFVWQGDAKKLYLDLNRNGELSDDPAGAHSAQLLFSATPTFLHQLFTNVSLRFPTSSAGAPMLVDLCLCMDTLRRPGEASCNAGLRSYWQGKLTAAGHDWQVGLLQNLSDQPGSFQRGQLLLRPWAERNQGFIAASEKPEDTLGLPWEGKNLMARASDAFAFSPKVFLEGRAWQLDWTSEPRGPEEKLALRLTEQPTALGEVRITGSSIHRLVLTGEPYAVVLDEPAASVRLPTGRYQPYRVWLREGKGAAYLNYGVPQTGKPNVLEEMSGAQMSVVSPPPPEQAFAVEAQRVAVLAVGGPLTNCVSATPRGQHLLLSYRLTGAGGGEYRLAAGGGGKQPQFTIDRSGRRIGAGQFEYG
jgi:hypothetical protein